MQIHVITGGAGFLGANLTRCLLSGGHRVICVDNCVTGAIRNIQDLIPNPNFTFYRRDAADLRDVLGATRPTHIWAMAALASPVAYFGRPLETAWAATEAHRATLEVAADCGARLLYTSTSEVYGDPEVHPQPETYRGNVDPLSPRSCYDEGKRYGEVLCRIFRDKIGVDIRIVRLFNCYGPWMARGDGRMIPAFIEAAERGGPLPIHGTGKQTRSMVYVDDLIDGLISVMSAKVAVFAGLPHGGLPVINLGNPQERTVEEIARIVWSAVMGGGSEGAAAPLAYLGGHPDDPKRRCPDISRAQNLLHWTPRMSLEDGIVPTVAWFSRNRNGG